jgi:hypothetical protein
VDGCLFISLVGCLCFGIGVDLIQLHLFLQSGIIGNDCGCCQWLIAQLVEHSLSVMKDLGSNLGADICLFHYWSVT